MKTISTGRGPLAIPDERAELDSWSIGDCLAWLVRCDPNGEWLRYVDDFAEAVEECGSLTDDEAREQVWEISRDA